MRKRKIKPLPRPGYFVDVRTFAAALTSKSFDLAGLANFLGTENRKIETQEHGKSISEDYLFYAKQDVQVTWECYCKLLDKFAEHNFKSIFPHQIFSEASIGKAYFKEMNIRPFREVAAGLSGLPIRNHHEHLFRRPRRSASSADNFAGHLLRFSVNVSDCLHLDGIWRFVIANGLIWRDSTAQTTDFLRIHYCPDAAKAGNVAAADYACAACPDADIFPVRAAYGGDAQTTIGLNYFSSDTPLWFTLADCITSKLLTGKTPKILQAITFYPRGGPVGPSSRS